MHLIDIDPLVADGWILARTVPTRYGKTEQTMSLKYVECVKMAPVSHISRREMQQGETEMKGMAIQKLGKELKELKSSDEHIKVMQQPVHDALVTFCRQDSEFAQAVVQGGSFEDCMKAVAKNCGSALSDLEAYRRAVQFYFPGADIRFQMSINLCASVEDGAEPETAEKPHQEQPPVVLDLFDLL